MVSSPRAIGYPPVFHACRPPSSTAAGTRMDRGIPALLLRS